MAGWNLDLVERGFADAAVDPAQWITALEILTKQTESFGTVLLPVSGGGPTPATPYTETMGESAEVYFRGGWHQRDERYRGVPLLLERGVIDDLDMLDPDQIQRHPYYQEFLAPLGLQWFAGVKVASETDVWCLSIQRRNRQAPFSDREKQQLAWLSNRLSSSAVLSRTLGNAAADGALDAFDVCKTAVVLINRRGEVFRANQSAEHLLVGDIQISRGKLTTRNERATSILDRTLHELIWRREASALAAPVLLPRQGQRPLLAYPVKLSKLTSHVLADCQCAIVLVDPDKRSRPLETALQTSYRLTEAEARLAARLASGTALATVAAELGIAKETSRSQLKSVFMKTGTHRQAELVALLAPLLNCSD